LTALAAGNAERLGDGIRGHPARHVGTDGVRVGRHCSVTPRPKPSSPRPASSACWRGHWSVWTICPVGVTFEGWGKPAVVSRSQVWKPKRGGGGDCSGAGPVEADTLPCRAVHMAVGGDTEQSCCSVPSVTDCLPPCSDTVGMHAVSPFPPRCWPVSVRWLSEGRYSKCHHAGRGIGTGTLPLVPAL
jgi:hypothetical protein